MKADSDFESSHRASMILRSDWPLRLHEIHLQYTSDKNSNNYARNNLHSIRLITSTIFNTQVFLDDLEQKARLKRTAGTTLDKGPIPGPSRLSREETLGKFG